MPSEEEKQDKCEFSEEDCGRFVVAQIRLYDPVTKDYRWYSMCKIHAQRYLAHMGGY